MGLIVLVILAGLEIALAIWTCTKQREKKDLRRNRVIVRAIEIAVVVIAMLLPFGQKWRFAGVLAVLAVLLLIALLVMLIKKSREDGIKKTAGAIVSCVLNVLLIIVLLVPSFIFTGYNGLPVTGEYEIGETSAILVDSERLDPFEQDGSSREVPVHFYYPKNAEGQFPLVVFSHGAFGYYQSNSSTYMELASNGYVVVALDHPHQAFFTNDTAGKLVTVDPAFMSTAVVVNGGESGIEPEELLKIYKDWMDLRTGDMDLVVDELEEAAKSGTTDDSWFIAGSETDAVNTVISMMDTSKIGLMGHSMGGATSVALGREREDITAVVDIDGTMLSEYTGLEDGKYTVNAEPYTVPILEFTNWDSYADLEEIEAYTAENGDYPNFVLMNNAAEGFKTTIRDTKHMDYTDLPLLSPTIGKMLGSGDRDNVETMNIVNSTILQFYNCYLKGEGTFTVQEEY